MDSPEYTCVRMTRKRLTRLLHLCDQAIMEMEDSDAFSSARERDECWDAREALAYAIKKRKRVRASTDDYKSLTTSPGSKTRE